MDLKDLTNQVCQLSAMTASYIQDQANVLSAGDVEEKGKQNLVTYVDRASESMLVEGLGKLLPGANVLAEESEYPITGSQYTWIIDPLDGTTNFIHGLPIYSISIALMKDTQLQIGVVYDIPRKECFYAWQGSEAYLNGKVIRVSQTTTLSSALLVTGFPYKLEGKLDRYLEIFKELIGKSRGVRRLGSAAIDLCYVAAGRMEGFYEYGLNPWDVAAGALILNQAGGKVTDFHGMDHYLHGKELIATNGWVHGQLQEIIIKHFN